MKINVTFNEKEKDATMVALSKVDPNTNWATKLNSPIEETEDIIDYKYDGKESFYIDIPDSIIVLIINWIGKFSKLFMGFLEAFEDLGDKIIDEKCKLAKKAKEESGEEKVVGED